ncbi:MAG: extracellular solute-binding protein [Chloroflexota bacterium]|nr:extracellular solute-binding protein [Chloroflexota bacterium]
MVRSKRLIALVAVGAMLVGCVPGSGQATPSVAPSPAGPPPAASASAAASSGASTAPSFDTSTPVTLTEWDTETSAGPSGEMDALNAAFHAKYPNVTIKRTSKSFDDYVATIKLAASAPDAPDVYQGNEGYSVDAALVKAGLIVPLDDYSKAYGWETRFGSPATLDVLRWSNDGTTWTKGPLWGIAQKAEVLGVFYNKATFQRLGLKLPTTFDEFQATLAAAKAGAVEPIVVGGLDGWPLGHVFMMLQALYEPAHQITNWTFAVPGSTFDDQGTQQAAAVMQDWARKGYFYKGFGGIGQDASAARFVKGTGLYFLTGPWENGTFAPMGPNVGWFALPGLTAGAPSPTTGSLSIPYHISKASRYPDIGAAYIDFITSPAAADVVAGKGDLPAAPLATSSVVDPQSSLGEIIAGFNDKSKGGLLTPYLDWASPTMGDTLFGGLQKLTASKLTPAEFTAEVQKDWSKAHPGP